MPEDGDNQRQLQSRLGDANIKEAQLISEKRILERRVAELRLVMFCLSPFVINCCMCNGHCQHY
jgi:hypothetical protein